MAVPTGTNKQNFSLFSAKSEIAEKESFFPLTVGFGFAFPLRLFCLSVAHSNYALSDAHRIALFGSFLWNGWTEGRTNKNRRQREPSASPLLTSVDRKGQRNKTESSPIITGEMIIF